MRAAAIQAITSKGLRTTEADYDLDAIIFATGFDAMTGALTRVDIRGRADASLAERLLEGVFAVCDKPADEELHPWSSVLDHSFDRARFRDHFA